MQNCVKHPLKFKALHENANKEQIIVNFHEKFDMNQSNKLDNNIQHLNEHIYETDKKKVI